MMNAAGWIPNDERGGDETLGLFKKRLSILLVCQICDPFIVPKIIFKQKEQQYQTNFFSHNNNKNDSSRISLKVGFQFLTGTQVVNLNFKVSLGSGVDSGKGLYSLKKRVDIHPMTYPSRALTCQKFFHLIFAYSPRGGTWTRHVLYSSLKTTSTMQRRRIVHPANVYCVSHIHISGTCSSSPRDAISFENMFFCILPTAPRVRPNGLTSDARCSPLIELMCFMLRRPHLRMHALIFSPRLLLTSILRG